MHYLCNEKRGGNAGDRLYEFMMRTCDDELQDEEDEQVQLAERSELDDRICFFLFQSCNDDSDDDDDDDEREERNVEPDRLLARRFYLQRFLKRRKQGDGGNEEDSDDDDDDVESQEDDRIDSITGRLRFRRSSALGVYLRLVQLSFRRCSFMQTIALHDALVDYVMGGDKGCSAAASSLEPLMRSMHRDADEQVKLIERAVGTESRDEVDRRIDALLDRCAGFTKALYLRYLNALYHEDVEAALECVHRYVDLAVAEAHESVVAARARRRELEIDDRAPSARTASLHPDQGDRLLPYASLNVALTHCHFGHVDEGLTAAYEAIRLAQERQDKACTGYALACLAELVSMDASNASAAQQLFEQATAAARALGAIELASLATFAAVRHRLSTTAHRAPPAASFWPALGSVDRAVLLASVMPSVDKAPVPPHLQQQQQQRDEEQQQEALQAAAANQALVDDVDKVAELSGGSHLLRARCWQLLGQRELAELHAGVHIKLSAPTSNANDVATAFGSLAALCASRDDGAQSQALLAEARARLGGGGSRYQMAPKALEVLGAQVRHEIALGAGRLGEADACVHALLDATDGATLPLLRDAALDARLRRVRTFAAATRRSPRAAVDACNVLLRDAVACSAELRIETLLLLAEAALLARCAVEVALSHVLDALALAKRSGHRSLEAIASLHLADIELRVAQPEQARALLERNVPHVSRQCSSHARARLSLLLARCAAAALNAEHAAELADRALAHIDCAQLALGATLPLDTRIEVLHLAALMANRLARIKERDAFAAEFDQAIALRKSFVQRGN
jgi:Anaphase-promoting complex subunit 5